MKHYEIPGDPRIFAFELDGSQDHLITSDMVPCEMPVPAPYEPTLEEQIEAVLAPYKVSRREIQAIIAVAELDAKVVFLTSGVAIEVTLAESFARNKSYRVARQLEDACRVIELA
jgi:hypothetical protein